MSSPFSYFHDISNRNDTNLPSLLSLDIETDSLNHKNGSIWSIAVNKKNSISQFFIQPSGLPASPSRTESIYQHFKSKSGAFGQEQIDRGVLDPLIDAIDKGTDVTKRDAVKQSLGMIDPHSVVLIQNANFENRWFSQALTEAELAGDPIKIDNLLRPTDANYHNSVFHVPPEVKQKQDEARGLWGSIRRDPSLLADPEALESYSKATTSVIDAYKSVLSGTKAAVTTDLMDFSIATYALAAQKGLIDPKHMKTGLRVDFLSQVLLGAREQHDAAKDNAQIEEIFNRITGIADRLSGGTETEEDLATFAKIKKYQPLEAERQTISSVLNRLEEIRTNKTVTYRTGSATKVSNGPTISRGVIPIYDRPTVTTDSAFMALHDMLEDQKTLGNGETEAYKYLESVLRNSKTLKIEDLISEIEAKNTRLSNLNFGITDTADADNEALRLNETDRMSLDPRAKEAAKKKVKDSKHIGTSTQKLIDFAKEHKGKLAFAGGMYALLNMDVIGSKEKVAASKDRRSQANDNRTIEKSINLYDNSYHGDGFVAWNNRKKHHEM